MWIYTKRAFFSIVAHRNEAGRYLVRTRTIADADVVLGMIREQWVGDRDREPNIIETSAADYRYRLVVNESQLLGLMAAAVAEVDYDNFKHAAGDVSKDRESTLLSIWALTKNRLGREDADERDLRALVALKPIKTRRDVGPAIHRKSAARPQAKPKRAKAGRRKETLFDD